MAAGAACQRIRRVQSRSRPACWQFGPTHGSVLIHEVGDNTRIDYTPDRGFTGTDSFAVQLIPGDAKVNVAVMVTAHAK